MVIDCETCIARPRACGDCVVTHLLAVRDTDGYLGGSAGPGGARGRLSLDDTEVVAVATMSAAGLVPPLRLVPATHPPDGGTLSPVIARCVTPRDDTPLWATG